MPWTRWAWRTIDCLLTAWLSRYAAVLPDAATVQRLVWLKAILMVAGGLLWVASAAHARQAPAGPHVEPGRG